jgi:hypothetical protein
MTIPRFVVTGPAKRFAGSWLSDLAREIERQNAERFEPFGAALRVRPAKFNGILTVGEGLSLDLDPDDVKTWEWFGSFEADLVVRARRRFRRNWSDLHRAVEVKAWAQAELDRYLQELSAPSSP